MSGRPALVTRYSVTLTAAHFPVGDEVYEILTLDPGEYVAQVKGGDQQWFVASDDWDADPADLAIDADTGVVTVEGAGDPDGAATLGTVTVTIVVLEPGLAVVLEPPEVPE